jgi:hypothetical protein
MVGFALLVIFIMFWSWFLQVRWFVYDALAADVVHQLIC